MAGLALKTPDVLSGEDQDALAEVFGSKLYAPGDDPAKRFTVSAMLVVSILGKEAEHKRSSLEGPWLKFPTAT